MSVAIGLVIVWLAGIGLIVLCARRPNAGRMTFGVLFLACSLGINGAFAALAPATGLRGIAHPAPLPVYRSAVEAVVRLFTGREVVFFALLMAYELAVALLYLAGGRATKAGIIGGALFNAAILLVYPLYTTMNATLVAAQHSCCGPTSPRRSARGGRTSPRHAARHAHRSIADTGRLRAVTRRGEAPRLRRPPLRRLPVVFAARWHGARLRPDATGRRLQSTSPGSTRKTTSGSDRYITPSRKTCKRTTHHYIATKSHFSE